jgi:DNA-binding IclR family transcriptional regulator
MSISLAAVLGKCELDDEVMTRVHNVAMDTSRGHTLDLVNVLGQMPQGMEIRGLSALTHTSEDRMRTQFKFLRKIGIVETDSARKRWRITPRVMSLFKEIKNA